MKRKKEEELQDAAPEQAQQPDPEQAPRKAQEPDYYDQLLRLKADFENYRKRVDKEKPELIAFGRNQVLCGLLPIYDTLLNAKKAFERVPGDGQDAAGVPELRKGLEMVYSELEKLLVSEGITCMDCVGKPFDPMCHEVLGVVEDDSAEEGLVREELQRGFMAGHRILRPARVRITRRKQAAPDPEQGGGEQTQRN